MATIKQKLKIVDAFGDPIVDGCTLSVQNVQDPIDVYAKSDGELYFKPYGKEQLVKEYFSNDLILWINS